MPQIHLENVVDTLCLQSTTTVMLLHHSNLGKAEIKSMVTLSHGLDASGLGFNNLAGSW